MNDESLTSSTSGGVHADSDDTGAASSAGALLKAAREASGLHIAALAVSLKVSVKKLEALEQDRLDLLPDTMFARALASSICRSLKLDPAPVLRRLPQGSFRASSFHEQRPAVPFQPGSLRQQWPVSRRLAGPVPVLGLVLLVGATVVSFLPEIESVGLLVRQDSRNLFASGPQIERYPAPLRLGASAPTSDVPGNGIVGIANMAVPLGDLPLSGANSTTEHSSSVVRRTGNPSANTAPSESADPRLPQTPLPVLTGAAVNGAALLTLTARRESWVKVTDAKGTVLLSRLVAPSEVVRTSGVPPLEAVVGRADALRVEVRGKWLDLVPLSRENVARFEVR